MNIIYFIGINVIIFRRAYSIVEQIICNLQEYGPCDLSNKIPPKYKANELYLKKYVDESTKCQGEMEQIKPDYKYLGTNSAMLVCSKDITGKYQHIANIEYYGLAKSKSVNVITFGVPWKITTTMYMPKKEKTDNLLRYTLLKLKNKDCSGISISTAPLLKKKLSKITYGKYIVSYISEQPLIKFLTQPVVCFCDRDICADDLSYDQLLSKMEVDGPLLDSYMGVTCVIGIDCIFSIPGSFIYNEDYFIASKTINSENRELIKNMPQGKYFYDMDKDNYITELKKDYSTNIYWIPEGRNGKIKVYVGVIDVLTMFIGNINVSPFGPQEIEFNNPNIFKCNKAYAFIYKENFSLNKYINQTRKWDMVTKSQITSNISKIDVVFNNTDLYILKYCDVCDRRILCKDNDSADNYPLIARITVRGIYNFQTYTCDLLKNCQLKIMTVDLKDGSTENNKLLISEKCGENDYLNFLSDKGISQNEYYRSYTKFKWNTINDKQQLQQASIFHLCWCNKIFIKNKDCDLKDYTTHVGSVLHTQPNIISYTCWTGSICHVIGYDNYSKERGTLTLSKSCKTNTKIEINNSYDFFDIDIFKTEQGIISLIKFQINLEKSMVGIYEVCWKLKTSETTNLLLSIEIKEFHLKQSRYYIPFLSSMIFKSKDPLTDEHYLLFKNDCNNKGDAKLQRIKLTELGLKMKEIIYYKNLKICWCVVNSVSRCEMLEDFKNEIGEVYVAGIMNLKDKFSCILGSKCQIALNFESYLNMKTLSNNKFNEGSTLTIRKEKCNEPIINDAMTFKSIQSTAPIIISKNRNNYIIQYQSIYESKIDDTMIPGEYYICYKNDSNQYFDLSKLSIDGIMKYPSKTVVFMGKAFTIKLISHNPDKDSQLFLSTQKECTDHSDIYGNITISMIKEPDVVYKDNGNDLMVWSGITVKRNHTNMIFAPSDISKANHFALLHKLYLCYSTKNKYYYLGKEYLFSGPRLIVGKNNFKHGSFETILDKKWYSKQNNLLLITFMSNPQAYVDCESHNLNQQSENVIFSFYTITGNLIRIPKYLVIKNSLVCWCGGSTCSSITDYKTTILYPNFEGNVLILMNGLGINIKVIGWKDEQFKVAYFGRSLSKFDEIRIVYRRIMCGERNSSKMSINLMIEEDKGQNLDLINLRRRNYYGSANKYSLKGDKFFWESHLLKLKNSLDSKNLMFKICFCPFLISEKCKDDEDFRDTLGFIVKQGEKIVINKIMLIRIFISYSPKDPNITICQRKDINYTSSFPFTFRMKGDITEANDFVKHFITRYPKLEGYKIDACLTEYIRDELAIREYSRFKNEYIIGIFRNQKINIKAGFNQDIIIRGIGIPETNKYQLSIITTDIKCVDSEDNNIKLVESTKLSNNTKLMFENIIINEKGTYRLCIRQIRNETSSNTLPQDRRNTSPLRKLLSSKDSKWMNIGFLRVKQYYINYVSDLISYILPNMEESENDNSCKLKGYKNLVQLCVLLNDKVIILSDCNNNLWALKFDVYNGVVIVSKNKIKISLDFEGIEEEGNWQMCKEIKSDNKVIFMGDKFIVLAELPFNYSDVKIITCFKHVVINPLDATIVNQTILVSDGFTRSIYAFVILQNSNNTISKRKVLRNIYCSSIQILVKKNSIDKSNKLFCLNPEKNRVLIFNMDETDINALLSQISSYDGTSQFNFVTVGYLDKPYTMDIINVKFMKQDYVLLVVAESTTGRIIIFKLIGNEILGYKVMFSRGLISRIRVDPETMIIYISSWRTNLGNIEQFIQNKPIEEYVKMKFYYNVPEKYQSGDEINLEPIKKGDFFDFFYEKQLVNQENVDIVSLNSLGLSINFSSGKITGIINATGRYSIRIYGSNLLKEVETTIKISASCPPTKQFDNKDKKCHECRIGTYRNDEIEDVCIVCSSKRPNSTTKQEGSRYLWECMCEPGYYLKENNCIKCEEGTWKDEIGDFECSGTCGNNMTSKVVGAKSLEELKCSCITRFYNAKDQGQDEDYVPKETLKEAGLMYNIPVKYKDLDPSIPLCIPCDYGYYCKGGDHQPKHCGVDKSTKDKFSSTKDDCECDKGYGYNQKRCVPCSQFGYKDTIGNSPCIYCHENSVKNNLRQLKSDEDLFKFHPNFMSLEEEYNGFGITYLFQEHIKKYTEDINNPVLVTNRYASTSVNYCQYCISGYYFDNNVKDCFKCPYGSYCPGFDQKPKRCGKNSVTNTDYPISPINCTCTIRYGNAHLNRNPINLGIECHQCPVGYFQHLEFTDIPCLPCPENTTTTSVGSSTIQSCIPQPGNFILALLKVPVLQIVGPDNYRGSENFEEKYMKIRSESKEMTIECTRVREITIDSIHTATVLREKESECSQECLRNIYCTAYSFDTNDYYFMNGTTEYTTNHIRLFGGTHFIDVELNKCKLYFFNFETYDDFSQDESENIKVCRIIYPFQFETVICPLNHYCSGTRIPTKCHKNSVTLEEGAKSIESCLCIPGYEPSTVIKGECSPCNIGWYKEEVGNFSCKRCPEKFKTFQTGSRNSTDCACTQGYYAVVENPDEKFNIINDYIITDRSIIKENEEIYVEMEKKGDDFNRSKLVNGDSYKLSLTDSLVFIPSDSYKESDRILGSYKIRCEKCKNDHYCPGGWFGYMDSDTENNTKMDIKQFKIHNIAYKCPSGSGIPPQSTNPSSISQCLCLPGFMPQGSSTHEYDSLRKYDSIQDYFSSIMSLVIKRTYANRCLPCEPGMFKEGQENSSCSGRCMEYATTYGGSVSESQCFCRYGRYMSFKYHQKTDESNKNKTVEYRKLSCSKCMEGAVCPGGLHLEIVNMLKRDYTFDMIKLQHHVKPMPKQGYFPAYPGYNNIERGSKVWNPRYQNFTIAEKVSTEYVEFHPCQVEFRCGGRFSGYCSSGSTGYICTRCLKDFDIVHFRSSCIKCESWVKEVSRYLLYKTPLFLIIFVMIILIKNKLFDCLVIIKIFLEFCITMIPYGIISIFTNSSIKQFVQVYNNLFGISLKTFIYLRIGCVYKIEDAINYVNVWYLQRLISFLIPLIDSLIILMVLVILIYTTSLTKKLKLKNRDKRNSHSFRENRKKEVKNDFWSLFIMVLTISYFLQIHFIWIEIIQMMLCVSVKYKKQDPIMVLLHIPSEMCDFTNPRFLSMFLIGVSLIILTLTGVIYFIIKFKSQGISEFFGFGYRKRYKSWDCLSQLRRMVVVTICTFQIEINPPSDSGRLRVISSLMLSILVGVVHLNNSPFNLRSDDLFNKLQILGIIVNIGTAIMIQGSYSYDFNYASYSPIFLLGGYSVILIWYLVVEGARTLKLEISRTKNMKKLRGWKSKFVYKTLNFFTSHQADSQITYNLKKKSITVETPFESDHKHVNKRTKGTNYKGKKSRLRKNGRNAISLSIHQSINKLILERGIMSVPSYWMEFLISHTMTKYDSFVKGDREDSYTHLDEMVVTPWIISKFTLETPEEELDMCMRRFDPEKPNQLREIENQYNTTMMEILEKIKEPEGNGVSEFSEKKLNELVEMTHRKGILEENLKNLELELEKLIENAKQGEKAIRYVIKIQEGVKRTVETPLTNDEILRKIEESTGRPFK